ncbi:MAG: hypothetical protein ABSE04_04375 [Candidatus Microgenomates bacterium]
MVNPIDPGTQVYRVLEKEIGDRGIPIVTPMEGMELGIGLIYLDIYNLTRVEFNRLTIQNEGSDISKYAISSDTNLYSVVYKLSFKNFRRLFPRDMPPVVSDELASNWSTGPVDYIKIPHHGSTNGITDNLLKVLMPEIAVISVGKNSWGFPKLEILDMLAGVGAKILRTDLLGDVEVVTDGNTYWVK